MKTEELTKLNPQLKQAIQNSPKLMAYLAEEIACAGSLEAAIYNCLSIQDGRVYDTDGNLLEVLGWHQL